jgi:hypothetical protein
MQRITPLPVFIYDTVSSPYRIKVFVSFCQSRPLSRGLDIREPPRRSTTSSNPSPPLRNCVVGKRWSQATRGWPPAVQLVHAFQNAFCLMGERRPGACTGPWPSAKIRWQHSDLRNEANSACTEIPPLLSLPLRWVNRFGCATRDHLKLASTQPCLACGRSPSDAHSQVCTSARARTQSQ